MLRCSDYSESCKITISLWWGSAYSKVRFKMNTTNTYAHMLTSYNSSDPWGLLMKSRLYLFLRSFKNRQRQFLFEIQKYLIGIDKQKSSKHPQLNKDYKNVSHYFLLFLLSSTFFSVPLLSFPLPFNSLPWSPCSQFIQEILSFSTSHVD